MVASLTFNLLLFVSQNHTYVNLTDLDLKAESVGQSGIASFYNDRSLSQSKTDSLSSQMATLSKYFSLYTSSICTAHVQCLYSFDVL